MTAKCRLGPLHRRRVAMEGTTLPVERSSRTPIRVVRGARQKRRGSADVPPQLRILPAAHLGLRWCRETTSTTLGRSRHELRTEPCHQESRHQQNLTARLPQDFVQRLAAHQSQHAVCDNVQRAAKREQAQEMAPLLRKPEHAKKVWSSKARDAWQAAEIARPLVRYAQLEVRASPECCNSRQTPAPTYTSGNTAPQRVQPCLEPSSLPQMPHAARERCGSRQRGASQ